MGSSGRAGSARSTAATSRRGPTARLPSSPTPTLPRPTPWPNRPAAKVADIDAILAAKDVDAVAICSPTDTHADLIERAARASKAIFCEKPIDLDVDRIRACLEVVKQTSATLMVGFNRRFDPNFANLRKRVAEGAIGALEIVSITSRDPAPPPLSYIARSGGLFRDMMIHDFDMARFILGEEPVAVSAMGSALVDKAIGEAGDIDTAIVIMETASGRVAQISNSRRATYGYDQRVEAHGANGMLLPPMCARPRSKGRRARLHQRQSAQLLPRALRGRLSQRTRRVHRRGEDRRKASAGRRGRSQGEHARGRGLPVLEDKTAGLSLVKVGRAASLAREAARPIAAPSTGRRHGAGPETTPGFELGADRRAPPPQPPTLVARLIDAVKRHRATFRRLGWRRARSSSRYPSRFSRKLLHVDGQIQGGDRRHRRRSDHARFRLRALSYLALTGYDGLALRHLGIKVPYWLTALASFTSYAFSFTLGFPLMTGAAVRYWVYGPAGLSARKVASFTIVAGVRLLARHGTDGRRGLPRGLRADRRYRSFPSARQSPDRPLRHRRADRLSRLDRPHAPARCDRSRRISAFRALC